MNPNSRDDDPTDFEGINPIQGILPILPDDAPRKDSRSNAATAASAAGVRAFTAQAIAFYFRAPVKAFFRTRVDYLAYVRSVQQQSQVGQGPVSRRVAWLRSTTPGLIAAAVRTEGWRIVPEQILPPLVANVAVGALLYTSYLQILGRLHDESSKSMKRVYPPPSPADTFTAGLLAGGFQSFVAAPLDAIQVRYERRGEQNGNGSKTSRPQTMWGFGREKLKEIGARGVFAGWGISFLKDSFGSAVFFSTFEYVKAQGCYNFIQWYYGSLNEDVVDVLVRKRPHEKVYHPDAAPQNKTIKPHYAIEPGFLMLAGLAASVAQQCVIYPLSHVQNEHWQHLEELDEKARKLNRKSSRWRMFRAYYRAYQETWVQCNAEAQTTGGLWRWLYRGFWYNTMRQVPSTSAGLIIFELVRRKYGMGQDEVRITRGGYDILLA